eukprot:scaffold149_cov315-Pinguiococcus_pyrenoidosus.AAC.127
MQFGASCPSTSVSCSSGLVRAATIECPRRHARSRRSKSILFVRKICFGGGDAGQRSRLQRGREDLLPAGSEVHGSATSQGSPCALGFARSPPPLPACEASPPVFSSAAQVPPFVSGRRSASRALSQAKQAPETCFADHPQVPSKLARSPAQRANSLESPPRLVQDTSGRLYHIPRFSFLAYLEISPLRRPLPPARLRSPIPQRCNAPEETTLPPPVAARFSAAWEHGERRPIRKALKCRKPIQTPLRGGFPG